MKYSVKSSLSRSSLKHKSLRTLLSIATLAGVFTVGFSHLSYVHADPLPTVDESGTLASSQTWTSGNVYVIDSTVTVPSDVTLTINAGAIVKYVDGNKRIVVDSGGTLNASGTSESPIIFTSYEDDSAGGDTNGDGSSSGSDGSYNTAIDSEDGGAVSISHAIINYAGTALNQVCADGASTSITDSTINNPVTINGCTADQVSLERNSFDVGNGQAIQLTSSDATILDLSGSNKNNFSGTGQALAVGLSDSNVPTGETWTVDSSSGAVILNDGLTIDGTLNIDAGSVIKTVTSLTIDSTGTLNVSGSSGSPVIFTSYEDDSEGGDTYGDGSTTPAVGDYSKAIDSESGGNVTVSYATIEYGSNAVWIAGGGSTSFANTTITHVGDGLDVDSGYVTYRGTFGDASDKAIVACDWGVDGCNVDAAYTDWGSVDGPFDTGDPSNNLACGAVTVVPWVYGGDDYGSSSLYHVGNCGDSETPDAKLSDAVVNFESGVSSAESTCETLGEDVCDAVNTAYECLTGAVDLAESFYDIPFVIPGHSELESGVGAASDTSDAASTYIHGTESESVPGDLTELGGGVLKATQLFIAMSNAYNSCEPS